MTAEQKLVKFIRDPQVELLLSVDEFETLAPIEKGFCVYIQADWDESGLKHLKNNPYPEGSVDHEDFNQGSSNGMFWAQDLEE